MMVADAVLKLLSLLFILSILNSISCSKKYPLEPLSAQNIADFVLEPSGLTFCETTGHIYAICDRHQCDYIYEMETDGTPVRRLKYDKKTHDDVEAVACYDAGGFLYIAEEEKRKVTVFLLEDYRYHNKEYYLKEVKSFYIEEHGSYLDGSGIEGLTVNSRTGEVYAANEKLPIVLYQLSSDYVVENRYYPTFSGDISDIFYDSYEDKLWILSDKSEKLFVTSLDASVVYDYWELPMKNAEGLAIDNTVSPKMLYIATDPSSPQGAQYVAALYTFYKPEIGTGLNTHNIPPNPPIICDGCEEIHEEAELNQERFDRAQRIRLISEIVSLVLVSVAFIVAIALIVGLIVLGARRAISRRKTNLAIVEDEEEEIDQTPFTLNEDDDDFASQNAAKDTLVPVPDKNEKSNFWSKFKIFSKKEEPASFLMVPLNQDERDSI